MPCTVINIMDGLFDDVITANRDLVRQFTYLQDDEETAISLAAYNRVVYNLQTAEATPTEILTVDTDNVLQAGWLEIASPSSSGVINLQVPGSALVWTPSDSGKWEHEMVLMDASGGILRFFFGSVLYKKPIVIFGP